MAETENKEYKDYRKSIAIGLQLNYLEEIKKTEIVLLTEKEEIIQFYQLNNSSTNSLPQLIEFYKKNSETLEKLAKQSAGYLVASKPWEHKGESYEFVNEFARKFKETDLFRTAQNNQDLKLETKDIDNFVEEHMSRLMAFQTVVYNAFMNELMKHYVKIN